MRLILESESGAVHREETLKALSGKYGGIDHLEQKSRANRCADPAAADDLLLWRTLLQKDSILIDTVHYESPEMIAVITPRRLELVEMLRKEPSPLSVMAISRKIRRDYKNVYDDLKALAKAGMVDWVKIGRDAHVSTRIRRILVVFEESDISY